MSLINDALKRARQAQRANETGPPQAGPLEPVDYAAGPGPLVRFGLPALVLAALVLAGWFFWKWREVASQPEQTVMVTNVITAPVRTLPTIATPPPTAPADSAVVPGRYGIKVNTNVVVRPVVEPAPPAEAITPSPQPEATVAPIAPAPPFPTLRLSSIVYKDNNSAAVIDGEMLRVGEEIKGARVVGIDRFTVTLEWKGQTNVLRLRRL